jgi:hypothetical protein
MDSPDGKNGESGLYTKVLHLFAVLLDSLLIRDRGNDIRSIEKTLLLETNGTVTGM